MKYIYIYIERERAISEAMQPVGIGGVNHRVAGMR
jgi:hypothetical protein